MAEVVDVNLTITRDARWDRATVTGTVKFSPGEIRLGLSYELHIFVVETDDELDRYMLVTNGFLGNLQSIGYSVGERVVGYTPRVASMGDEDEAVAYRAGIVLTPPASGTTVPFSESLIITPSPERGNEEYQAIVWVVPEVCMGTLASNMVSINLG